MASDVGPQAVAPLRRGGGLLVHRDALGEPARHVELVMERVNTWLISCHIVLAQ
jgi:hypothetical protein